MWPLSSFYWYIYSMQINLDKKSGVLVAIIAALLVIIVVLIIDKVEDDGNMVETHMHQIAIGSTY